MTQVQSLGREDPLEKVMAIHPSILAWKIPWTEESSGLQSMGSQRVRHDLVTEHAFLKNLSWICCNIVSVLRFCFLAIRHVGS